MSAFSACSSSVMMLAVQIQGGTILGLGMISSAMAIGVARTARRSAGALWVVVAALGVLAASWLLLGVPRLFDPAAFVCGGG